MLKYSTGQKGLSRSTAQLAGLCHTPLQILCPAFDAMTAGTGHYLPICIAGGDSKVLGTAQRTFQLQTNFQHTAFLLMA